MVSCKWWVDFLPGYGAFCWRHIMSLYLLSVNVDNLFYLSAYSAERKPLDMVDYSDKHWLERAQFFPNLPERFAVPLKTDNKSKKSRRDEDEEIECMFVCIESFLLVKKMHTYYGSSIVWYCQGATSTTRPVTLGTMEFTRNSVAARWKFNWGSPS